MNDLRETIIQTINYIEENLYNKISLDDISIHTGLSKYYLHRIFKSLTGESIIEYVQGRKLTSSINELINSNMRIIDIALNYGNRILILREGAVHKTIDHKQDLNKETLRSYYF